MFRPNNNDEPSLYTSKTFLERSFTYDHQNPSSSSRHEDHPFFMNFPSPFIDDHELPLSQILPQQLQDLKDGHHGKDGDPSKAQISGETSMPAKAITSSKKSNLGATPQRRTGKKDRHSKISTAQGVRDRRVRLSLHIARKFFDLQDMLGFDKASKTIEWLFSKSNNAIKDLSENMPQKEYSDGDKYINSNLSSTSEGEDHDESLVSECEEVVSRLEENSNNERKEKGKLREMVHKRESRNKARARARERTKEKMMIKGLDSCKECYETNPTDVLDQLGSSNNSAFLDQESNSYNTCSVNQEKGSTHETISPSLDQFANSDIIQKYSITGGIDSGNCFTDFVGNWENVVPIPFAG